MILKFIWRKWARVKCEKNPNYISSARNVMLPVFKCIPHSPLSCRSVRFNWDLKVPKLWKQWNPISLNYSLDIKTSPALPYWQEICYFFARGLGKEGYWISPCIKISLQLIAISWKIGPIIFSRMSKSLFFFSFTMPS